jgi:DNA-binding MarR family transcriptional regulator
MKKYPEKVEHLAKSLRDQHNDLNVDNTYNFLRTSEILNNYLTVAFKKNGLNRTQVIILHFLLASGGSATPTQMRTRIFRSMNAISKSMDTLDKMGLTKSKRSKKDRRERRVSLTDKGLTIMEKILPIRRDLFARATNCLNRCDASVFNSLLNKMEDHLLNITKNSSKPKQKKLYF